MKYMKHYFLFTLNNVASCVEAWIEIIIKEQYMLKTQVASCVEAWIEIFNHSSALYTYSSPPAWRRGLKFLQYTPENLEGLVASCVEAWIEIANRFALLYTAKSPPAWRRGLK